ncbi:NAD(P)H-quinone oxidoreductase [Pararhizobium haloflavum]|uniref:NAD(P)H-quinone oxidoreductase n=1 Tax=Pararhizobium haloflavum TaxID=2037914 RepID=UPI000C192516|nr:NAD(P)H-quinone oxidoreductase [Pararhizobium haloflavum]
MKAVEITKPGGPDVLAIVDRPMPEPGAGEVLIAVKAAGINRPDCLQRVGAYPPPPGASDIPGLEVAGQIAAVGEGVTAWSVGEAVCALIAGGGYATHCVAHEGSVLPIPGDLSMAEAAAVPETFFTVWHNVFERGGLKGGETLLVHGGTSGIGTTAIQLAKAFDARVIATAGSKEKCEVCRDLGADHAINYREEDFVDAVKAVTDGHGADVILDMVGGDYISRNYSAAAIEGRIVQIAFLNGRKAEADFSKLMMKRLTHTGSTLRARDAAFKARLAAELKSSVWPLIASGRVKPVMDTILPFEDVKAAHARIEDTSHIGKIVLEMR